MKYCVHYYDLCSRKGSYSSSTVEDAEMLAYQGARAGLESHVYCDGELLAIVRESTKEELCLVKDIWR